MGNILERSMAFFGREASSRLDSAQMMIDGFSESFARQASDAGNVGAMLAGASTYKFLQSGLSSAASRLLSGFGGFSHSAVVGSISAIALGAEVSAYRSVSQLISPSSTGIFGRRAWWGTFVDFVALKPLASLARNQNPIFFNSMRDLAMVGSHAFAAATGLASMQAGSFLEEMIHAQTASMAMEAGMALAFLAGGSKPVPKLDSIFGPINERGSFLPSSFTRLLQMAGNPEIEGAELEASSKPSLFVEMGGKRVPLVIGLMPELYRYVSEAAKPREGERKTTAKAPVPRLSDPAEVEDPPTLLGIFEQSPLDAVRKSALMQLAYVAEFNKDWEVKRAALAVLTELGSRDSRALYYLSDIAVSPVNSRLALEARAALKELAKTSPVARGFLKDLE